MSITDSFGDCLFTNVSIGFSEWIYNLLLSLSISLPSVFPSFLSFQRIDPGPCKKVHSEVLKNEYEVAHESEHYNFNEEVLTYLQRFMDDIDKRIKANKERIENYQSPEAKAKVNRKY